MSFPPGNTTQTFMGSLLGPLRTTSRAPAAKSELEGQVLYRNISASGDSIPFSPHDLLLLNLFDLQVPAFALPSHPTAQASARHQGGMGAAVVGERRQLKFLIDTFREIAA